ncbi:MAG: hypothetical protein ABFR97_08955 [Thermodesulfobacteriota bacterium]
MYEPAAFLISITALTSIFSFFFGGYFRERERAYRLWLKYVAYDHARPSGSEAVELCAELESKNRMFFHAKGLLTILIITIILDFMAFQLYSHQFACPAGGSYDPRAVRPYYLYSLIMGIIVFINVLELAYIQIAVVPSHKFPFFTLRRRITGQVRLSKVWMLVGCCNLKDEEYNKQRIPKSFYDNQDHFSPTDGQSGANLGPEEKQ